MVAGLELFVITITCNNIRDSNAGSTARLFVHIYGMYSTVTHILVYKLSDLEHNSLKTLDRTFFSERAQ